MATNTDDGKLQSLTRQLRSPKRDLDQDEDLGIDRLIMVSTTYRPWKPGTHFCDQHGKLLTRLLLASEDRTSHFARATREPLHKLGPELDTTIGREHMEWLSDPDAGLNALIDDLRSFSILEIDPSERYEKKPRDRDVRALAHRIFLDEKAVKAITPSLQPDGRAVACLDFRFADILHLPMCVVSLSVWSKWPYSQEHAPSHGEPDDPAPDDQVTAAVVARFKQVRDSVQNLLDEYLPPAHPHILGKLYQAPLFWIAPPTWGNARLDPICYLGGAVEDIANRLSIRLLGAGDVRDCLISWGVLCGHFLTLRRVAPSQVDDSSQPSYLILPARPRLPDDSLLAPPDARLELADALCRQEEAAARLIMDLTRLELYGTEQLFDIVTDLEIWRNHLEGYGRAVDEAATLWDRLATHLLLHPSSTDQLEHAHRAIQLVHQTVLQAVADVNLVARLVDDCVGRVEAVSDDLANQFNAKITATHPTDDDNLHEALTSSGNFRTVREYADQVAKTATRVRGHYSDVMTAIRQAFDERRVRESDKAQKAGTMLSAALAGIAFVTILDAVFNWKFDFTHNNWVAVRIFLTALPLLAGVIVLYFLIRFWQRVKAKPLADEEYSDKYYPLVWNYLRRSSTDRLDRHETHVKEVEKKVNYDPIRCSPELADDELADREAALEAAERLQDQREKRRAEQWNKLDQDLARELASVWDAVCKYREEVVKPRDGAKDSWEEPTAFNATTSDARHAMRLWQRLRKRSVRTDNQDELERDLTRLQKQVQSWSLHTLVLTERPRALWPYELPLLTCLYRALSLPDWAAKRHHKDDNFRAVADIDFAFVFRGGPELSIIQTNALRHWLDKQLEERRVATDLESLRDLLERSGVRVEMDAGALKRLGVNVDTPGSAAS